MHQPTLRLLGPALALILAAAGCGGHAHNTELTLDYRVRILPGEGIDVLVLARGTAGQTTSFQLLNGLGMIQNQPGHVDALTARTPDGLPLTVTRVYGEERTLWEVEGPAPDGIVLRYRILPYDPSRSPEATFVSTDQALVLGYSVFLVPVEISDFLPTKITVRVEAPETWRVWTSWPESDGRYRPRTSHELWSGGVCAGNFRAVTLEAGPTSVTVLTEGWWSAVTALTVANRLHPVLRKMVELFGAPPDGDTLDLLAVYRVMPVRDNKSRMMGVSESNVFFCVATQDRYENLQEITALAAHECLHFYLGGALVAEPEPPYGNAPELVWLIEGVTEYLAYRLMLEADVMTPDAFDRVVEEKRAKLSAQGAIGGVSVAAMARRFSDPEVYQLVYSRGFLAAALLDRGMTEACGEGSFDAALRDLFETWNFHRTHEWINEARVREVFESRCPGSWELVRRYAMGEAFLPAGAGERPLE